MGIIMKRKTFLTGIALTIFSLFASQTFAASGSIAAACDPAAAAAACDPGAVADNPSCTPAAVPAADCNSASPSADGATPASCSPAAALSNSGCLSSAPGCSSCSACGKAGCGGLCSSCAPHGCAEAFFGKLKKSLCEGVCWSGYMNAGYFTNFAGDRSNGYTDCWSNTTPAFNALYVAAEKKAYTGGCGYDFGFGIDFMFGEDARIFRSARGWDDSWVTGHMYDPGSEAYDIDSYGFAMPQLYMEMAINNWSVKLGHFYGVMGYEGATANSRFFYTKGLLCQVSPVSQTGVLATYRGFENLDITLGWVNGWNNGFDNSEYGEGMVTGAFTYRMNKYASIKYAFLAGTAEIGGEHGGVSGFVGPYWFADGKGVGSAHDVVLDLQLTGRLESVSILHYSDFDQSDNPDVCVRTLILGQHLYYDLNSCTKVGFRAEWLKLSGLNNFEMTTFGIGLNYHPAGLQNLYIRPELRYDKLSDKDIYILNGRPDQFTIGFDVMLTF